MQQRIQVLILEPKDDWLHILQDALIAAFDSASSRPESSEFSGPPAIPEDAEPPILEVNVVHNATDLARAREKGRFDLAVFDLWLDPDLQRHDKDEDGTHDDLEALVDIAIHTDTARIIILSDTAGYQALPGTPGVPGDTHFMDRKYFDAAQLTLVVRQMFVTRGDMGQTVRMQRQGTFVPPVIGSRPGQPRILIIEDQTFWQETLAKIMEDEGYFWRVAGNPEQAIGRLQLESFNMVLLNLTLGENGGATQDSKGWPLLEYLVANCPHTKLLVISGNLSSTNAARLFMSYPVKGFVDKTTFNRTDLIKIIHEQGTGPALKIQTFGDFRVWRNGNLITNFGSDVAERALKLLLARRGEPVTIDELLERLWPGEAHTKSTGIFDGPELQGRPTKLTEAINSGRMALEPDLPRASDSRFIRRENDHYFFDTHTTVEIDALELIRLVQEARQFEAHGEYDAAQECYESIGQVYQGDFLPGDRALSWTAAERTALQKLYTGALNHLADIYARHNQLDMAIQAANRALQLDAYIEGTYRRLMRYHACKGDKPGALGVYRALVKLFSELIGEEVSPATKQLFEDIGAGVAVDCIEPATPAA